MKKKLTVTVSHNRVSETELYSVNVQHDCIVQNLYTVRLNLPLLMRAGDGGYKNKIKRAAGKL